MINRILKYLDQHAGKLILLALKAAYIAIICAILAGITTLIVIAIGIPHPPQIYYIAFGGFLAAILFNAYAMPRIRQARDWLKRLLWRYR